MQFEKNRLFAMLERKEIPLGIQCFTGSPVLIEVLGLTGFDFVMIDTEHSGNDVRALESQIRAAEVAGVIPYARIPDLHNEADVRRAIEAGAEGLFLPMVRSVADVLHVADAAYFPPKGKRGICPAVRAANYSFASFQRYADWNNSEIALIPMIEHPDAVRSIDEICALEMVRAVVFGAGDLAYAMGEGTLMMKSPNVQDAYRTVLAAAKRHRVAVIGGPVLDPTSAACRKALEDGVTIFCLGLDTLGFRKFCEQTVAALNAGIDGSGYVRRPAPHSTFQG